MVKTSSQQILTPTDISTAFWTTSVHNSQTVAPMDLNLWTWYLWKAVISLRLRCSKPKHYFKARVKSNGLQKCAMQALYCSLQTVPKLYKCHGNTAVMLLTTKVKDLAERRDSSWVLHMEEYATLSSKISSYPSQRCSVLLLTQTDTFIYTTRPSVKETFSLATNLVSLRLE